jgi:N-acyl-D-aspartate/D-glutamate deacylase
MRRDRARHLAASIAVGAVLAVALARAQEPAPAFDLLLRHGTIVDGTGRPRYSADVAIDDGRIVKIGALARERAAIELDARGLFVTPGFINLHSHPSAQALPRAENMLSQGVTTEILNPDGGGPVNVDEQLTRLQTGGLAVNVGAYIGFNSVWSAVVGPADRRPEPEDIEKMRGLIRDGLGHGAWGVSAGLDYKPAYFARTDEVIRVVEVARPWRTNFTNHDRVTPESNFSSIAGMTETLEIAEAAGLAAVITHMKVQGHEQGSAKLILDRMRRAVTRGQVVAADAYPYLAGQTGLGALLVPAWAQDGGPQAMRARFADASERARIVAEIEQAMTLRFGGAAGVYLPSLRKQLVDVMEEMQAPAGEAVVRLLEQSSLGAILRFGREDDLRAILRYTDASIACDCGATTSTSTHPRNYGTYPRVLGRYVREAGVLSWESAIRKMTALPAATIGTIDRGVLAVGMVADITVFDPKTVIDRATYESPAQLSEGIRHVLVNGRIALRDGTVTGEQSGRVLRRAVDMPTRLLRLDTARRVATSGTILMDATAEAAPARLSIDVRQEGHARSARGTIRLADPVTRLLLQSTTLGVLQSAPGWSTVSGRARIAGEAEERAFTLVVDAQNPLGAGRASVTVRIGDAIRYRGTFDPAQVSVGSRGSKTR